MSQITIRMIPDTVENEIRRLAAERRISLSKMVIFLLQEALGIDPGQNKKRDLSCIFGKWDRMDFEEFEENTKQFSTIDEEIWK